MTEDDVLLILSEVIDPDVGISIVDLGLIYKIMLSEEKISVTYTLTSPACPYGELLEHEMHDALRRSTDYTEIELDLVFEPLWTAELMSDDAKLMLGISVDL